MKASLLSLIVAFCSSSVAFAQTTAPAIDWQHSFGGTYADQAYAIQQTSDGGYVATGISYSTDGTFIPHNGDETSADAWVMKFNSSGQQLWKVVFGGSGDDQALDIKQTADGGYIVVGTSASSDGSISNNHGSYDLWLVKLTSSGQISWSKTYGGTDDDGGYSVQQTSDGGYIAAGYSSSANLDVSNPKGEYDVWVIKVSATGTLQWQKSYGGTKSDNGYSIQPTTDGGYIIGATSASTDGDVSAHHGTNATTDIWVVKINSEGILQWQKSLGGSLDETVSTVHQTSDNGFIVCGSALSHDGDVDHHYGGANIMDAWIAKLTATGDLQWETDRGGTGDDLINDIIQTDNGAYVAIGSTSSADNDVSSNHGLNDLWLVEFNNQGAIDWEHCYGGVDDDQGLYIIKTTDGGFAAAGISGLASGDVTSNADDQDAWIVKFKNPAQNSVGSSENPSSVSVYPNPASTLVTVVLPETQWQRYRSVTIYNPLGQPVLSQSIGASHCELGVSGLAKGYYYYIIRGSAEDDLSGSFILK